MATHEAGVDADGLPVGPDALGQQSQDGAWTASHVSYAGARHNARCRPLRCLMVSGACAIRWNRNSSWSLSFKLCWPAAAA
jgi:hypothetical protein